MKKYLLIVITILVCLVNDQAHAQRYLPGQKGIQFTGGMVDGVSFNKNNVPYYIGGAFSKYNKNGNRWVIGGEFLTKNYTYKQVSVPVNQFTGEIGYYISFFSDQRKTFFCSVGFSGLAGYETSNNSKKHLYDGATLLDDDTFLYGGAGTLEIETYVTDRIVFLVNVRERLLAGSSIGKFHTQLGIGLKIILN